MDRRRTRDFDALLVDDRTDGGRTSGGASSCGNGVLDRGEQCDVADAALCADCLVVC